MGDKLCLPQASVENTLVALALGGLLMIILTQYSKCCRLNTLLLQSFPLGKAGTPARWGHCQLHFEHVVICL